MYSSRNANSGRDRSRSMMQSRRLLGYLSWRDTKTALLVFNKTTNSTEVRKKMHAAMESRSEHRKTVSHEEEGDSRYVFAKLDEDTELIITTQVYDVPDTQSDGG